MKAKRKDARTGGPRTLQKPSIKEQLGEEAACRICMHPRERRCSLYSIDYKIPKLDVAGSNPVSRSIFSITSVPYCRFQTLMGLPL